MCPKSHSSVLDPFLAAFKLLLKDLMPFEAEAWLLNSVCNERLKLLSNLWDYKARSSHALKVGVQLKSKWFANLNHKSSD